jgi:diaminopimelate decarboxylase
MFVGLSDESISDVFRLALASNRIIEPSDTAIIFYDISALETRLRHLCEQFPPGTLHAAAIKANPLVSILTRIVDLGAGLEAASLPELRLALHAGAEETMIVFDSPVKTADELLYALTLGCHINADSIDELDRIARLRENPTVSATASIGVRINPQVGSGTIAMTSVAAHYSKFGVSLMDQHHELLDRFLRYEWLTAVHLHIGSQGCTPQLLVDGVAKVLDFVHDANSALRDAGLKRRITRFDLGGGLPVSYHKNTVPFSMEQYASLLRQRFPELFDGTLRLITEFGRYLHANAGWVATKVEYVKHGSELDTAMVHVGADLFLRECYAPADWQHEFAVVDNAGRLKSAVVPRPYVIAGPLCFAGDILGRNVLLPPVEEGDHIVIRDTGAYTLGMWSRYNSRQIPKVVGYRHAGAEIMILKERESVQQILDFWS